MHARLYRVQVETLNKMRVGGCRVGFNDGAQAVADDGKVLAQLGRAYESAAMVDVILRGDTRGWKVVELLQPSAEWRQMKVLQ